MYIFVQENAFENVVWKMAAILSRPKCVNIHDWLRMRHILVFGHGLNSYLRLCMHSI